MCIIEILHTVSEVLTRRVETLCLGEKNVKLEMCNESSTTHRIAGGRARPPGPCWLSRRPSPVLVSSNPGGEEVGQRVGHTSGSTPNQGH